MIVPQKVQDAVEGQDSELGLQGMSEPTGLAARKS